MAAHTNKWSILWVTTSAMALTFLDNTVMPVALPTLERELAFSPIGLIWVVNSYLLTILTLVLIGGRLCDLWGMRRTYRWGLIIFGLGSLLAGLGFSKGILIAGRIVQGVGGALIIPTTGALIIDTFPPGTRAKAIGINTGISSIFLILGPAVGGFFTEYLNWRGIFWINIPVVIYALILSQKLIAPRSKLKETFHVAGALPLALSIIGLVVALMEGSRWGWSSPLTLAFFCSFPIFFSLFLWASKHTEHPLVDFSIFKQASYRSGVICIFLTQFVVMVTVLWAIYFQENLGFSAAQTGLLILIATFPVLLISPIAGIIADRFNARLPVLVGFILLMFSLMWFVFFSNTNQVTMMLPGLLSFGCGIPCILSPAFAASMLNVASAQMGTASAITSTVRQLASTLGMATMTALFYELAEDGGFPRGFRAISWFATAIALSGFLFALFFFKEKRAPIAQSNR